MTMEITMEELRSRQASRSTTPLENRAACEHCNSPSVSRRGTGFSDVEEPYYCENCHEYCEGSGDATQETIKPDADGTLPGGEQA